MKDLLYFIIPLWLICLVWIYMYWQDRIRHIRKGPKFTTTYANSFSQASGFGQFISERGEDMNLKERCSDYAYIDSIYRDINEGELTSMYLLIRECHLVGCEIVIRQMGEEDLFRQEDKDKVIREYRTGGVSLRQKSVDDIYIYGLSERKKD